MKPFLFLRGTKQYARFFIPATLRERFAGRTYLTFAIGEGTATQMRLRSCILESQLMALIEGEDMEIDLSKIRKYELDLGRGIVKAEAGSDHAALLEALAMLRPALKNFGASNTSSNTTPNTNNIAPAQAAPTLPSILLKDLLEKFFKLKKVSPATIKDYSLGIDSFTKFYKQPCRVADLRTPDITQYREYLGEQNNSPRTIDKKIGVLRTILNFGIEQGYYSGKNPAQIKSLLTKKQKASGGYQIFEREEIQQLFCSDYFKSQQSKDPDYYWCCILILVTGARHEEIAQLERSQIKTSAGGTPYIQIRASKTTAGIREVPLPPQIFTAGFASFIANKQPSDQVFRYRAGNALGKKFKRHIEEEARINRGKLVLHSLRKFLNDQFLKNGVSLEVRCQFVGHELDNVNVLTYSNKFNVDELRQTTKEAIDAVLKLADL